ncbi:hypothetical protein DPMN_005186 [Dreissena polymorpha]|uniref:Uncharacterized protein n=1 Tax=Dreissena polymorpha TaxID=45954 RepID=A0A9D4MU30_DREPO|nr:hypothetical protein DPMN_005186 [Dreissena polymorpha]
MARQRPTRAPQVEIDRIVIREVQYQLEVNWCRNEEIIVKKAILDGRGLCGRGAPGLVMGPYIVEIDRIVIRVVQYQFEVNWCRNEEIIVKGYFGLAWPMWAGCPRIDRIVIRKVQYQFEKYSKTAILGGCGLWGRGAPGLVMGPCIVEIDRNVIREVSFQGSSAYSVGGDSGQDGRKDGKTDRRTTGQTAEITTISQRFSKSTGVGTRPDSSTLENIKRNAWATLRDFWRNTKMMRSCSHITELGPGTTHDNILMRTSTTQ